MMVGMLHIFIGEGVKHVGVWEWVLGGKAQGIVLL
jgi:hypothetical protein